MKINKTQLDYLWDTLVNKSQNPNDEQVLFKWLKDSCDSSDNAANALQLTDIGKFFEEKIGGSKEGFIHVSLDGFQCIQSYFLLINE